MATSWSGLRRELEEEFLCPALRGRVQYFVTRYHGAPDQEGRASIRVDGQERLRANPYDPELRYRALEHRLKQERAVPMREYVGRGGVDFLYDAENRAVEDEVTRLRQTDGVFGDWEFREAAEEFRNLPIDAALASENPLVRLLAVLDRRVGKRRFAALRERMDEEPEWLRYFYRLRLEAEGD